MTLSQITKAIAKMNKEDLDVVNDAIHAAYNTNRDTHINSAKTQFSVGDNVQFSTKRGQLVVGSIIKINPKTIVVRPTGEMGSWKVTPTLLSHVGSAPAKKAAVPTFVVGDKVEFPGWKNKTTVGTVNKINRVTVIVGTAQGQWKVSKSLLKQATTKLAA